jgi:phage protein U
VIGSISKIKAQAASMANQIKSRDQIVASIRPSAAIPSVLNKAMVALKTSTPTTSTSSQWGSLGDVIFDGINGPMEFSDKQEAEFAEHPLILGKPRLQFLGTKLEEITLKIRLHNRLQKSPDNLLSGLLKSMNQGDPLDLVVGRKANSGIYCGKVVIASIDHDRIEQWPNGKIRLAEVSIKLKEWVPPATLQVSKRKAPPAVKKRGKKATPRAQTNLNVQMETRGGAPATMPVPKSS